MPHLIICLLSVYPSLSHSPPLWRTCKMHLNAGSCTSGDALVAFVVWRLLLEPSALLLHSVCFGLWTHWPALCLGFLHHHLENSLSLLAVLDPCVLDTQLPLGLLTPSWVHVLVASWERCINDSFLLSLFSLSAFLFLSLFCFLYFHIRGFSHILLDP